MEVEVEVEVEGSLFDAEVLLFHCLKNLKLYLSQFVNLFPYIEWSETDMLFI